MKQAIIVIVMFRVIIVACSSCANWYRPDPHFIMRWMLSDYVAMSMDINPNEHYKSFGIACDTLDQMTKVDLSPELCMKIFLYYRWLDA